MQGAKVVTFLLQASLAPVFSLRLNNIDPAPAYKDYLTLSLEPGEWIVEIRGSGPSTMKKDFEAPFDDINLETVRYIEHPYFIRSANAVRLRYWYGRLGNNLYQLFHAISYAESKNISTVKLPAGGRHGGPMHGGLFDLPLVLQIQPKPSSAANCSFDRSYFGVEQCTFTQSKEVFRQALHTYVKPHLKPDVNKVCQSKDHANHDLVIHLRGGDLNEKKNEDHGQSRMPPCSFYRHLVEANHFRGVTLVVEDGAKDHNCRTQILTAFAGSTVVVKETNRSLIDDACTLMTSPYVTFGLSTFAETLTMMNDQLKKVYVPAFKGRADGTERQMDGRVGASTGQRNGGKDLLYGDDYDFAGKVECNGNFQSCAKGAVEYALYDIPGFSEMRTGQAKADYLYQEGVTYPRPKICGHCVL